MKDLIKKILQEIGEDPSREGLQNTPERVEKSLKFLTSGYWVNIEELVNGALYEEEYDEMVIVKDIDLFSMCETTCYHLSENAMSHIYLKERSLD